jgi:sirohydrochlorin ferrochelatase
MRALAAAVGRFWNAPVTVGFLDFDTPTVADAVRAGGPGAIVIPALLTHAFHGRIDLPAAVAAAGMPATVTAELGCRRPVPPATGGATGRAAAPRPEPLLLKALATRAQRAHPHAQAVALLAAGTTDIGARAAIIAVADELGRILGLPAAVGYASSGPPTAADAIDAVGVRPADTIGVSYFLAPGRLADAATDLARASGVRRFTHPLAAPVADELVHLVLRRATAATRSPVAA